MPDSPGGVAEWVSKDLRARANRNIAEQNLRFFRSGASVRSLGIRTSELRALTSQVYAQVKALWSVEEALQFAGRLLRDEYLESKAMGILVLSRFRRRFTPDVFRLAEKWIDRGYCSNWATLDALATLVIHPCLVDWPRLVPEVQKWAQAENEWLRRASAVSLVKSVRRGEHLKAGYEVATGLFNDRQDLVQKAVGWLLREAGKTDSERLAEFLLKHGPCIPRTTLRYAIERFPRETRTRLLKETRRPKAGNAVSADDPGSAVDRV